MPQVRIEYEDLEALGSIEDAMQANSYFKVPLLGRKRFTVEACKRVE